MPRFTRRAVIMTGFALGLAIWAVPLLLFNQAEPWNGRGPAYALALVVAGFVVGFLGPRQVFAAVAGVFGGQLMALIAGMIRDSSARELWLVSLLLVAGYTFVATGAGALLGTAARLRLAPVPRGEDRRSR
jgi:peptidoglycan/LPS O-acetylase OafA/YrhL